MANTEVLIQDSDSLVVVIRNWLPEPMASSLFQQLDQNIPWKHEEITIYGKQVPQPRLTFSCGEAGVLHTYSRTHNKMTGWVKELETIKDQILFTANQYIAHNGPQIDFNACLLNKYRTGQDYIGQHADKEVTPPHNSVATVSLGDTRRFYFYTKSPHALVRKTLLHQGDLVLMLGQTQNKYYHTVPKQVGGNCRISLTYRLLTKS